MDTRKLWLTFAAIIVGSFAVLGWFGREIYRQAPPVPARVVTTDGTVLFTGDDIRDGQNVWQSTGGQELGTVWGHGSYVAPDWSADWLHREAVHIRDAWSRRDYGVPFDRLDPERQAGLEVRLQDELRANTYDPATGTDLWFCEGFTGRGAPTPDFAHGLLYVVNGKPGNNYVVKPGGSGDVTKTHRVWDARRQGGRDLPSPAVVGDYLLISSMSGILTTYDAKTGEIYFTERLNAPVSGAPLVIEGLVYFQMENGEVIVVRPGKTLDIVTRNTCGSDSEEIFRAALSPIQGQLFTRSQSVVYCIGK